MERQGRRGKLARLDLKDQPDRLARKAKSARPGDHILIMSNGGFGGLHGKVLTALAQ